MSLTKPTDVAAFAVPEEFLAQLESSTALGCVLLSQKGEIVWANVLFRSWLGLRRASDRVDSIGSKWLASVDDSDALERAIFVDGARRVTLSISSLDGKTTRVAGELFPQQQADAATSYLAILHAVDDVSRPLVEFERSARLEALGSLTSGVAHDFNNLLTILVGNLALVAEDLREQPKQFAKIKSARDAARRGSELITQLLSFARQEPVPSQLINPSKVIARIAPLIQRALGRSIKLELDLDDSVDPVHGNSAQLESVIVNLAVNARDAIDGNGTVWIRVRGSQRSADGASDELAIEVSDDGAGIPPDLVDRVFEPFFTTKTEGRGSGLGLSMVKQYAEQFGGVPELVSTPGQGTTVRLKFQGSSGSVEDSAAMTMPVASLPSGDESVLVLANDDNLGGTVDQILSVLGYKAEVVTKLDAALAEIGRNPPDLVICDGMDIETLVQSLSEHGVTGVKILLLEAMGSARADSTFSILHKPFSLPDLALAVRDVLDTK